MTSHPRMRFVSSSRETPIRVLTSDEIQLVVETIERAEGGSLHAYQDALFQLYGGGMSLGCYVAGSLRSLVARALHRNEPATQQPATVYVFRATRFITPMARSRARSISS
jgi:hypothetical protein